MLIVCSVDKLLYILQRKCYIILSIVGTETNFGCLSSLEKMQKITILTVTT